MKDNYSEKKGGLGYAGKPDGRPSSSRPPGVPMGLPDTPGKAETIPHQKK